MRTTSAAASAARQPAAAVQVLFEGRLESERAPWDTGNTFAPHVRVEGGRYRMWYGGQGRDGHDRIHYAESDDGLRWDRLGVVLEHPDDNLINDPYLVDDGAGGYVCFYTVAREWIVDVIHRAESADGLTWTPCGEVLGAGAEGEWDALLVGRPSVLPPDDVADGTDGDGDGDGDADGVWRMWFDARPAFPPGLGQGRWPEVPGAGREVGLATSPDGGRTWTKHPANPLIGGQAGSVHVSRYGSRFVMVSESWHGVRLHTSADGVRWDDHGLWVAAGGSDADRYGHVTPYLLYGDDGRPCRLYMGLARSRHWTENLMGAVELDGDELDAIVGATG